MKALRLPAHANLLPYGFGHRSHALLLFSYSPRRSRSAWRTLTGPGPMVSRRSPFRHASPVGVRGISQVSWPSVPCLCPVPRPRPSWQVLAIAVPPVLPPDPTRRRPPLHMISRLTQGFGIRCLRFKNAVAVAPARLASGWRAAPLPGGSRTLWNAVKGFRSWPFSFPGLRLTQVGDTPIETLTRQHAQVGFSHVQPTAVFGGVVPLELLDQPTCLGGGKSFVE